MSFDKWKDHWLTGAVVGLMLLPLLYMILKWIKSCLSEMLSSPLMTSPVLELLTTLGGILTARYLMVNRALEQTGKGLMLVVLIAALLYLYYSIHVRHSY